MRIILSRFLIVVVSMLFAVAAIMLATPWGSRATIALINLAPMVSIDYRHGVILNKVDLAHFELDLEHIDIIAEDLHIDLQLACLLKKRLCMNEISARSFSFVKQDAKHQDIENLPASSQPHKALVKMPVAIVAKKLAIAQASIIINNLVIEVENLSAGIDLTKSHFSIQQPNATLLRVLIPESAETNDSPQTPASEIDTVWSLPALPTISIPLDLDIYALDVTNFELELHNKKHVFDNTTITGRWLTTDLKLSELQTYYRNFGDISLKGRATLAHPYPVDLLGKSDIAVLPAWPQLVGSTQNVAVNGHISDLRLQLESQGALAMTATAMIDFLAPQLPFHIDLNAEKIPLPSKLVDMLQPSTLSLTASGDLAAQELTLRGIVNGFGYQAADLQLIASHTDQRLQIANFQFSEAKTQSDLSLHGELNYADGLSWRLGIKSNGLTLPKHVLPATNEPLSGRIAGSLNSQGFWQQNLAADRWAVALTETDLSGIINNIPVALTGHLKLNQNWQLEPSKLHFKAKHTRLQIEGYSDQNWHVNGMINTQQLNDWLPESQGEIDAKFSIGGALLNPSLDFQGTVNNFFWQQFSGQRLTLNGHYQSAQQASQKQSLDLNLGSERLRWQEFDLLNVASTLTADIGHQSATLRWDGEIATDIAITGDWLPDTKVWNASINKAVLSFKNRLLQPDKALLIAVDMTTKKTTIKQHCWQGAGVDLCLKDNIVLGTQGELDMSVQLDMDVIDEIFIPQEMNIDTDLYGDILLRWAPQTAPSIAAQLTIEAGQISLEQNEQNNLITAWQHGDIVFKLNGESLQTQLSLYKTDTEASESNTLIDMNAQLQLSDPSPLSGAINIHDFDLRSIQAFTPEISTVNGLLNANINVAGTLTNPLINGMLAVEQVNLKLLRSPAKIENINLNVHMTGSQADISGGLMLDNNLATLLGNVDWRNELALDLKLDAERLTLALPPQVLLSLSPYLEAKLRNRNLHLSGKIDVLDGLLRLEQLPAGSVSVSDDVIIVDASGNEIVKSARFDVTTDIKITIADKFKIQGQGFSGRIGGGLQFSQKLRQPPQLFGNLQIPEGKYRAYGQRLDVEEGLIYFNGPANNPQLQLRAIRDIKKESIVVGIELVGSADAPELKLFSKPSMPQPEIVSYLVRGRGTDAKANDNSGIGMALGASLTNKSGIFDQLEKLPLVNNVEVGSDAGQAFIAGYLGERIYLKYGTGIDEPVNELTVRLYLLSRLWLETVSGLESSADLYYSFDID